MVELKVPMAGFPAGLYSRFAPGNAPLASHGACVPVRDSMTPSWLLTIGSIVYRAALNPSMTSSPTEAVEFILVGTIPQMNQGARVRSINITRDNDINAVSYTHLTLPTKRIVVISVVAVSLKK
eukprot:TRINITY_DN53409_c0_g1_i1.p1 TRINITY_DN53409_c0_g1~~TRINITY_DN53409_c0_g1_i1.p1  ORF type:complete len:124 (+),score=8.22 TRINITY_DN53409_c0_g1_i1:91-462(+)